MNYAKTVFKSLLTSLLLLICSQGLNAQEVSPETALKVAKTWLQGSIAKNTPILQKAAEYSIAGFDDDEEVINVIKDDLDNETLAYVIEFEPIGFIIISPDLNIYPIIGYSKKSKFVSTPSNQNILLCLIKKDLSNRLEALANGYLPEEIINKAQSEWDRLLNEEGETLEKASKSFAVWGPLLSTDWAQGSSIWNYYTPNNWVCGCVATAMSQILNYWGWPTRGAGSHSYTEDDAGTLSADFGTTTYEWSNMLDDYSGSPTDTQIKAVGLLTYHCGIAVNMNYESGSSGAFSQSVAGALRKYFRMSSEYVKNEGTFFTRLQSNMTTGKPALLSITNDGGHAIVADGFRDDNNYYHLNFGWTGGSTDAWYDINPLDETVGGYHFDTVNGAVLDIVPIPMFSTLSNESTTGSYTISWNVSSNLNADKYELREAEKSSSVTTFSDGAESGTGNWIVFGNFESTTAVKYSGSKSFRGYISSSSYTNMLTLDKGIYIGSSTSITYNWKTYYFDNCEAYFQVSTDGETWNTLKTYTTANQSWTSESSIDISGYVGNMVLIRFEVVNTAGSYYTGSTVGFFVDDISINNCYEVPWTTVDNNIANTSKSIIGKSNAILYYQVRPYRDSQWWDWSSLSYTTVADVSAPAVPTGLAVVQSGTNAVLTWTANTESNLTKYYIYKKTISGVTVNDFFTEVYAPATSYTDSDVSVGNTYYYKIAAVNSIPSQSLLSSEGFVTISSVLTLHSIGNQTINQGEDLIIQISTTYYGTRELTYSMTSNIPSTAGASFDSTTGVFSWTPDLTISGTYTLTFTVSDGQYTESETITVQVTETTVTEGFSNPDSADIASSLGGTIQVASSGIYTEHKVYVPPSAITTDVTIIIRPPTTNDLPEAQIEAVPSAINFVVKGYEEHYDFQDSVVVTLEYKDFEIDDNEDLMRVHYWDSNYLTWKRIMGTQTIDKDNNTVSAKIKHFTILGVDQISEESWQATISPGWTMISVPVEASSEQNHPSLIFGDDIYPFLLQSDNSSIYEYNESINSWVMPSAIQNGYGYIVWGFYPPTGSSSYSIDVTGSEVTGDVTHTLTYSTSDGGWHLVGNPYGINIDWDNNIDKGSGIENSYYRWTDGQYKYYNSSSPSSGGLTSTIGPWQGFWVHTTTDGAELTINYPGSSGKRAMPVNDSAADWCIQIKAQSGSYQDIYNYIGMSKDASEGHDFVDVYELEPLSSQFVSVYFPHPDWGKHSGNFTQDVRPFTGDPTVWDFVVATNCGDDELTLNWTIPEEIESELQIHLISYENGEEIDMREQSEYSYSIPKTMGKSSAPAKNANPRSFRKISEDDVLLHKFAITVQHSDATGVDETSLIPDEYYLKQNFPNPFNPSTTIEYGIPEAGNVSILIYNILGQEVRNLVNIKQVAGMHSVRWDGKDNWGVDVGSGVYFYKISANKFQQIQKLILLR